MATLHTSRKRLLLLALAVLLALTTAPVLLADDDDDDGGGSTTAGHRCVVKFVCGEPDASLRAVDGVYRTAVNILNADPRESVSYTKKLALTTPCGEAETGFQQPGANLFPDPPGPFELGPMLAFDVDCNEIFNEFLACQPFSEGFLILESSGALDVTAVYTAADAVEGGVSIDVEPVTCTGATKSGDDDDN
jgi:hypothetical protein